jgi:hypothetical protein
VSSHLRIEAIKIFTVHPFPSTKNFLILIFYLFKFLLLILILSFVLYVPSRFSSLNNLMQFLCENIVQKRSKRRRRDWTEKPERNLQWMSSLLCEMNSLTYPFQVLDSCSFIKVLCTFSCVFVCCALSFMQFVYTQK